MIEVKNIKKSFGNNKAVRDLSFTVSPGCVVGLLGPNGAGKTTTMRLIVGYFSPDEGSINVAGTSVIKNALEAEKSIGYLPENNPLYPDMLVSEVLKLSASLKGITGTSHKDHLDFAISVTGINKVFYRTIKELSKGYRQRVGLAVALLGKPKVIILDEPTEGLDPNQRTEIRAVIRHLALDHTVLMSTHVMSEASAVCGKLLIINEGRLVADASPDELSQSAEGQQVLSLEIEGDGVQEALQAIEGVIRVEVEGSGRRLETKIISSQSAILQPAIARLARDREWIIWKLIEESRDLEDVFGELTKGENL